MSVNGLKPSFTNRESYLGWRKAWKEVYRALSEDIRRRKLETKAFQRAGGDEARKMQSELTLARGDTRKMMTLMKDAKERRDRIVAMKKQMEEQRKLFPLTLQASVIDMHFNKGHLQFPEILPRWVIKAKGKTFYVDHIDANANWSTRELESGSTLGMIRFKKCSVVFDETGCATIRQQI